MENSTINASKVFIYTMCLIFMLKETDLFQLAQYVITKDTSDFLKSNGLTIFNTRTNVYLSFCTSPFLFIAIVLEKIFNLQIENQGQIAILGTNYTRNLIQRKKICFLERITEKNKKATSQYFICLIFYITSFQRLSLTSSRSETNSLTGFSSFFGLVACSYNSLQLGERFAGSFLYWMIAESHCTILDLSLLHYLVQRDLIQRLLLPCRQNLIPSS